MIAVALLIAAIGTLFIVAIAVTQRTHPYQPKPDETSDAVGNSYQRLESTGLGVSPEGMKVAEFMFMLPFWLLGAALVFGMIYAALQH